MHWETPDLRCCGRYDTARDDDKRQKALERELEWMRMSPKARQTKSKARISNYEAMVKEDDDIRAVSSDSIMPLGRCQWLYERGLDAGVCPFIGCPVRSCHYLHPSWPSPRDQGNRKIYKDIDIILCMVLFVAPLRSAWW